MYSCLEALPALRAEMLLRLEADLIVHLARAVDPVAEIDMGQPGRAGPRDVIEDHEGAERAVGMVGAEIGIDHGQAVGHLVGQRHGDQLAMALAGDEAVRPAPAVFDHLGVDMRVLDHHGVVEHRHVRHAAAAVARIEIGAEQRVLLGRRLGVVHGADQVGIALHHPLHVARRLELVGDDAHGNAGTAGLAGRPVGDVLRAAEAALRQQVVELRRLVADEVRKHLPFELPLDVGAGRRRREEELRRLCRMLRHRAVIRVHESRTLGRVGQNVNRRIEVTRAAGPLF